MRAHASVLGATLIAGRSPDALKASSTCMGVYGRECPWGWRDASC